MFGNFLDCIMRNRLLSAFFLAPAAGAASICIWAFCFKAWLSVSLPFSSEGLVVFIENELIAAIVAYLCALSVTAVIGGPACYLLKLLRIRSVLVYVFIGILSAAFVLAIFARHRIWAVPLPFVVGPLIGGGITGWTFHKILYLRRGA